VKLWLAEVFAIILTQMTEEIVLLDRAGSPIGSAPKLASHHSDTPLHLGFSCYVFNSDGQFLLTQRAKTKRVWPGVWTNSVCGHPAPGESVEDAIRRRLKYELGIQEVKKLELILQDYRYKTPPFKGIVENEVCPVYAAVFDGEPVPNPEEVESYKWLSWDKVMGGITQDSTKYSYWFKDQVAQLQKSSLFKKYLGS